MRLNSIVLTSVIVGSATVALLSGCSSQDPSELTADTQATNEELRRHCEAEQEDDDWAERCHEWNDKHHRDAGATKDASPPPPPPTTPPPPPPPPTTPPPPPPPPTTCTSFTYSAWGACQPNSTQTRTVATSSPAGCTGGAPVLSQACTYTPPVDGAALYMQYCSGCHGNGKKGKAAATTQSAINNNVGGMGSLSFLTSAQVAAIAAAP
ncbi:MAG TPA: cytochrome c [Labilithrix sp.]|nr:cytochrome c [Labilithrix sp.]